jgi:DNA-binding beta-propeller fold protein YncE
MIRAPNGLAVDMAGNLFLVDSLDNRIRKINPAGIISTVAGDGTRGFGGDGGPATSAPLNAPVGIAADTAGNLFIADSGNHRVRSIAPAGIITTML